MNSLTIKVYLGDFNTILEALDRLEDEFYEPANVTVKCDQFKSDIDTDWDREKWINLNEVKGNLLLSNIEVYGCTQEDLRYADEEEQKDVVEQYHSSLDEEPEVSELDRTAEYMAGFEMLRKMLPGFEF